MTATAIANTSPPPSAPTFSRRRCDAAARSHLLRHPRPCGCRISEALALTADRVDPGDGVLVFESLKKRRKGVYRAVPVPPDFLDRLRLVHDLEMLNRGDEHGRGVRLWPWSRATAWRRCVGGHGMRGAGGIHATPKGLRHGFGIKAVTSEVPST